jgi:hemerythrin
MPPESSERENGSPASSGNEDNGATPLWILLEDFMGQWIPWSSTYEVKVSEIDEQHRELFRMFNGLMDAVWDGKGKDSIKEMLDFTAQYAVNHFATEERYMQQYGFPHYIKHKKLHDDFTADVINFIQEYEREKPPTEIVVSVISNLGNWTRDHIRATDQELGAFLSNMRMTN